MKIRNKVIASFLILVIPILILGLVSAWGLKSIDQQINSGIKQNISSIETNIKINSYAQFIRYYDEVLTQSARNYAFTGALKWKERYEQTAPELDKTIKDAIAIGDSDDKKIFSSVDTSNLALVEMETKAINFVDNAEKNKAVAILEGPEYAKQKEIYQQGLIKYVEKQGKKYDDTLAVSTSSLIVSILSVQHSLESGILWTAIGVFVTIIFAIILGILIARLISGPINFLIKITREIANGNLNQEVEIKSNDEIGQLAESFNEMVVKVRDAYENIEKKVAERTAQLEKTNRFMVDRELKMIEMKKELASYRKK